MSLLLDRDNVKSRFLKVRRWGGTHVEKLNYAISRANFPIFFLFTNNETPNKKDLVNSRKIRKLR